MQLSKESWNLFFKGLFQQKFKTVYVSRSFVCGWQGVVKFAGSIRKLFLPHLGSGSGYGEISGLSGGTITLNSSYRYVVMDW